jgi:hypothetical protein
MGRRSTTRTSIRCAPRSCIQAAPVGGAPELSARAIHQIAQIRHNEDDNGGSGRNEQHGRRMPMDRPPGPISCGTKLVTHRRAVAQSWLRRGGVRGAAPSFDHAPAEPGTCRRSPYARRGNRCRRNGPRRRRGGVRLMLNRLTY